MNDVIGPLYAARAVELVAQGRQRRRAEDVELDQPGQGFHGLDQRQRAGGIRAQPNEGPTDRRHHVLTHPPRLDAHILLKNTHQLRYAGCALIGQALDQTGRGGGLFDKLMSAGKRVLAGDSFFVTFFMNQATTRRDVAFAAPYPGKIIPVHLATLGGELIAQKDSFLCAAKGVSVGIAFNRKLGAGLFGGEGFIMQRLQGDGWAFIHAGGTLLQRDLGPGELLRIDTGCLVAYTQTIDYDIQFVGGIKNTLFGGEGLFFATLRGPGKVWIQTLPISRLASRIISYGSFQRKEEGGMLGGLGNLLDGDGW